MHCSIFPDSNPTEVDIIRWNLEFFLGDVTSAADGNDGGNGGITTCLFNILLRVFLEGKV